MERRDLHNLTVLQEKILVEARERLVLLVEGPDMLGTGTHPHEWVKEMIEDIEHLLGY